MKTADLVVTVEMHGRNWRMKPKDSSMSYIVLDKRDGSYLHLCTHYISVVHIIR